MPLILPAIRQKNLYYVENYMIIGKSTYKVLVFLEDEFVIYDLEFVLVSHHQSLHMRYGCKNIFQPVYYSGHLLFM